MSQLNLRWLEFNFGWTLLFYVCRICTFRTYVHIWRAAGVLLLQFPILVAILLPLCISARELVFFIIERRSLRELIVLWWILSLLIRRYIDLRHLVVVGLVNLMILHR